MVLASLQKVRNPLARAAAAGLTVFSAGLMVAGSVVGFADKAAEEELPGQPHRTAVYVAIAGGIVGAIAGAAIGGPPARNEDEAAPPATTDSDTDPDSTWKDWRDFVVDRKVVESTEITSFYLKPVDGGPLPDFEPGQFLTIQLDIPGAARPVVRTYSLSDYNTPNEYYRLSIKREGAPEDKDVPPGLVSNFMHDRIEEGSVIRAKPPAGKFVLDPRASTPVALVSNGVGITPMVAMANAIARHNPQRSVWFVHGARNEEYHAFREAVSSLADAPGMTVHYVYSRPRPGDASKYDSQGYADPALMAELLGDTEPEYYLCGSPSFLDSMRSGLPERGVPDSRINFEIFSNSKSKSAARETAPTEGTPATAEVVFAASGKTATWTPESGTLLEFAEANGVDAAYSCRQGACLTCMCAIESGEVEYAEPPTGEPDEGHVLICISKPKSDRVVLYV